MSTGGIEALEAIALSVLMSERCRLSSEAAPERARITFS
jgi:hypothetical protein